MSTSTTVPASPGPRPHPSLISFAPECFVTDGTREEYSVGSVAGYPKKFGSDLAAATAYATRCGTTPTVNVVPVLRRVRWTVAS